MNVPLEPKLLHGNGAFTADPILPNRSRKNGGGGEVGSHKKEPRGIIVASVNLTQCNS